MWSCSVLLPSRTGWTPPSSEVLPAFLPAVPLLVPLQLCPWSRGFSLKSCLKLEYRKFSAGSLDFWKEQPVLSHPAQQICPLQGQAVKCAFYGRGQGLPAPSDPELSLVSLTGTGREPSAASETRTDSDLMLNFQGSSASTWASVSLVPLVPLA